VTRDVLVIGYGNTLRTDDGVGRLAAERLSDDPRLDGVTVIGRHQLTPELALDVSQAGMVVFVDASHRPPAGTVTVAPMERTPGSTGSGWSHHLDPPGLLALTGELYGRVPDAFLVSVGVESLLPGDRVSPTIEASLPSLVNAVAQLIADHAGRGSVVSVVDRSHA
jgi:hydrogenase maturation protease